MTTPPNNQGPPATRIIHNRRHKDAFGSPPYSPVYNTTTYRFENTADLLDVIEGGEATVTCTLAGGHQPEHPGTGTGTGRARKC